MRIRRVITIGAGVAVAAALVGSAVAYANAGDDRAAGDTAGAADDTPGPDAAATDPAATATDAGDTTDHAGHDDRVDRAGGGRRRHEHPALPPYDVRFDAASTAERDAAAELRDEVEATLAAYADVDAAVAAGYRAPRRPNSTRHHYLNPSLVRDGDVLDPRHPEGLVYYQAEGEDPVLLGAVFVAPPEAEAPRPAGDLVVWHSHDPGCPGFFATADEPCTDARRMLHVWTADTVTMTARRDRQRTAEVRFVDPFGAPFRDAVEVERQAGS